MPTVAELKKLVKEHSTDKPKLSAGKEALLLYCEKAGLLKKAEPVAQPVSKAVDPPAKKVKAVKAEAKEDMPAILKKPVEKAEKQPVEKAEKQPAKKAPSSFATFMSAHKGSGMKMSELAAKYKEMK